MLREVWLIIKGCFLVGTIFSIFILVLVLQRYIRKVEQLKKKMLKTDQSDLNASLEVACSEAPDMVIVGDQ